MARMKSSAKEAAGFIEEEVGEFFGNKKMAHKGRTLRNEGRVEKGKNPKLTQPGKNHLE